MLYATLLHLLAGAVAGSLFRVRSLLILLAIVLIESAILSLTQSGISALWALTNVVTVQVGYLAGIYARSIFEHTGFDVPSATPRRLP